LQRWDGRGNNKAPNVGEMADGMMDNSRKIAWERQQGYITAYGIVVLLMFLITLYELSVVYTDWSRIKSVALHISVLNDRSSPIPGVSLTIDDELIGQTDMEGKITALISNPGKIHLVARKKPLRDIDTSITLEEDGSRVVLAMNRPYAKLTLITLDEEGKPLRDVKIRMEGKDLGRTGDNGSITISDYVHILDSTNVNLSKSGYDDLSGDIYLADTNIEHSFAMVKGAVSSKPPAAAPSKPAPDFQNYINNARNYLDEAISGQSRYFGRALNEIDKAINTNPRSIPAKQLKVDILFNFAKSLRESKLPREAVNRLIEAQKIYGNIPHDQLYVEIDKLKKEIEKELGG
jgi:hypothetical protein